MRKVGPVDLNGRLNRALAWTASQDGRRLKTDGVSRRTPEKMAAVKRSFGLRCSVTFGHRARTQPTGVGRADAERAGCGFNGRRSPGWWVFMSPGWWVFMVVGEGVLWPPCGGEGRMGFIWSAITAALKETTASQRHTWTVA